MQHMKRIGLALLAVGCLAIVLLFVTGDDLPKSYREALGPPPDDSNDTGLTYCDEADGKASVFGVYDVVNPGPSSVTIESVSWAMSGDSDDTMISSRLMVTPDPDEMLPAGALLLEEIESDPGLLALWNERLELPSDIPAGSRGAVVLVVEQPRDTPLTVEGIVVDAEAEGHGGQVASRVAIRLGSEC